MSPKLATKSGLQVPIPVTSTSAIRMVKFPWNRSTAFVMSIKFALPSLLASPHFQVVAFTGFDSKSPGTWPQSLRT